MKKEQLTITTAMTAIAFAIAVVIISIPQSGCDEGMQITKPVLDPPGKIKQPEDTTPAEVIEVSYYLDEDFTKPLVDGDRVMARETIYTKVVFSKAVPVVIADDASARPRIFHYDREKRPDGDFNSLKTQYRIKQRGTDLQSGEAKPYQDINNIFICKFMPADENIGSIFYTFVNNKKFSDVELWFVYFLHREEPVDVATIIEWDPQDFTGVIYEPGLSSDLDRIEKYPAFEGFPAPGVTVTIMAGPRTGESTMTDNNGRYIFKDVEEEELHLRAERKFLEPKEVIVHRSRDTVMSDRTISNPFDLVQKNPGGIMLGHPWPDGIRFIFEKTLVMPDLLLFELEIGTAGFYRQKGVCVINVRAHDTVFAHEIAHAHQHAVAIMHGGETVSDWENTPEGKAYVVAREKDLKKFGKIPTDSNPGYDGNVLYENAARICQYYWGIGRWRYGYTSEDEKRFNEEVIPKIPNRLKWAEEWLNKKY